MEIVYSKRIAEVRRGKKDIEKKLSVKLSIIGGRVKIEGESLDEYDALQVVDAISFGFGFRRALELANDDFVFRKVHIKDFTSRNLRAVKARLIGTQGKTRKTMSEISGCEILIKEAEVGIIGYVEDVENTVTAITNLIRGSKQSNMYLYLEKMNRLKKRDR